jgi:hypothetical protein
MSIKRIMFLVLSFCALVPFNSVMEQNNGGHVITQEIINKAFDTFVKKVFDDRWYVRKTPDWVIKWKASGLGYDSDLAQDCIPLIYPFFNKDDKKVNRYLQRFQNNPNLDYINEVITRYQNEQPANKNSFARILHEEKVKRTTLPADVNKEELMRYPKKYAKVVKDKKVSKKELYDGNVNGLFIKHYLEDIAKIL